MKKKLQFLIWLMIQLILFQSISIAEDLTIAFEEFKKNVTCSNMQEKTLELNYQNKNYQIVFSNLYDTPVINSALVCERFLRSLRVVIKPSPIIPLIKIAKKSDLDLYADRSGFLEQICLQLGYCKRGIFDTFKVRKELRNCHGKVTLKNLLNKSKPRLLGIKSKIIKDLEIKVHPFYPFSQILYGYMRDKDLKEIHASTMSIGNQTINELMHEIPDSQKKLTISYDAGISLFNNQQTQIAYLTRTFPNARFIPLTSGHDFKFFYHNKFIASPETDRSMMASMNLSSANRSAYIDFNFIFSDPLIRDEFLSISHRNNQRMCDRLEDYQCLSAFYSQESLEHVQSLTSGICPPPSNSPTKFTKSGYFVNSEDDDLGEFVLNFIKQAKEEIVVTSYKLTEKNVASTLLQKQQEGLKVYAMLAYRSPALNKDFKNHFYSGDLRKDQYPFPHMKVIIIDRKLMLFGTANFSSNALNNTSEMLGITDNPEAIKIAYDYAAVFAQSKDLAVSRQLSEEYKDENYVSAIDPEATETEDLPFTEKLQEPWMINYRQVTADGRKRLKSCQLRHLIFITKDTYLGCLKELGEI